MAVAVCVMVGVVTGILTFTQQQIETPTTITGQLLGLPSGKHGFHVHELGNISNSCGGAGGHFNPFGKSHGLPTDGDRHAGDLGNVETDDNGITHVNITDLLIPLTGPKSIIGRSIVASTPNVHEGEDKGKLPSNPGARLGCCVIGIGGE